MMMYAYGKWDMMFFGPEFGHISPIVARFKIGKLSMQNLKLCMKGLGPRGVKLVSNQFKIYN